MRESSAIPGQTVLDIGGHERAVFGEDRRYIPALEFGHISGDLILQGIEPANLHLSS